MKIPKKNKLIPRIDFVLKFYNWKLRSIELKRYPEVDTLELY